MEEEIKYFFKATPFFEKNNTPPPFSQHANNSHITILLYIKYKYTKNKANNKIFTSLLLGKFVHNKEVNILLFTVFSASFIITLFSKKL